MYSCPGLVRAAAHEVGMALGFMKTEACVVRCNQSSSSLVSRPPSSGCELLSLTRPGDEAKVQV